MSPLPSIILRDLGLAWRQGGALLPVLFFLLIAVLFPFAVGSEAPLLLRTGGGALWMGGLLAALLPIERLIAADADAGILDLYAVRGLSEEGVAAAKLAAHWLSFGPPLLIASLPAAALLGLDQPTLIALEISLAIGTIGLASLALITAAVTAGLRQASALAGLLMLPLAVPILIFGAGALQPGGMGAIKLLAALSLAYVAAAPFVAGFAIRALRD